MIFNNSFVKIYYDGKQKQTLYPKKIDIYKTFIKFDLQSS